MTPPFLYYSTDESRTSQKVDKAVSFDCIADCEEKKTNQIDSFCPSQLEWGEAIEKLREDGRTFKAKD